MTNPGGFASPLENTTSDEAELSQLLRNVQYHEAYIEQGEIVLSNYRAIPHRN